MGAITELDFSILEALQNIHTPVLNVIMAVFTYLGEGGAMWIVILILFLCFRKTREMGFASSLSLILELVISELIIKNIFKRPEIDTIVHKPGSFSFPSGHTCTAFCAATAIFCYDKRLGIIAYIISGLIGFSRNYFYIHYPSDVLVGAVEGVLLGLLAVFAVRRICSAVRSKAAPDPSEDRS